MTRTVVLFLGVIWTAASPAAAATTAFPASAQSASADASNNSSAQNAPPENRSSAQSSASQNSSSQNSSGQNPQPQNSPASNGATSSSQTSTSPGAPTKSSAPVRHKKKPVSSDCTNAATPSSSSTSSAATSGGTSKAPSSADSGAPPAPANCPPKKTIVPEGSTAEPSIELAGGPSSEQAAQRNTANQMLGTAEENLKKMDGRQLSANQKDVISQIRQFIDQSRTAVKAGELDRARTLAWKAQTLSEELIKPENQ